MFLYEISSHNNHCKILDQLLSFHNKKVSIYRTNKLIIFNLIQNQTTNHTLSKENQMQDKIMSTIHSNSNSDSSEGEFNTVSVLSQFASFDEDLEHVITNVLKLPLDNPIALAINHFAGVKTWHQFKYMDECDVFEAFYYEETNGTTKNLTKFEQKILRWLIGYIRENIDDHKHGSEKASFYTSEAFTKYTQDRRRWLRNKAKTNRKTTTQQQQQQQPKKAQQQRLQQIQESEPPPSSFGRMSTSAPNLGYNSSNNKTRAGNIFPELKQFLDDASKDDESLRSFLTDARSYASDEESAFMVIEKQEKQNNSPPTVPKRTRDAASKKKPSTKKRSKNKIKANNTTMNSQSSHR